MNKAVRPNSREAILDAAIATLVRNPGASISEIAIKAGVGRATLHRHYASREDLIAALQELSLQETNAAVAAIELSGRAATDVLLAMLEAVIPLGDRWYFLHGERTADENNRKEYRKELDWVATLVEKLKKEGAIGRDIPSNWAVGQIDSLIWLAWCEIGRGEIAPLHAPALVYRTIINGLR